MKSMKSLKTKEKIEENRCLDCYMGVYLSGGRRIRWKRRSIAMPEEAAGGSSCTGVSPCGPY